MNNFSWRRIKRDFLHHFHKPRLDLLVWILITKLAPNYYRKLDLLLNDTGRYRELPSWRKSFKREWKKLANTPIEMPINPKYRPDIQRWVCTCPYFVTSRFLVCKHLVQSVGPVPATFYLQVRRNRTTPFWLHPILQPEGHHIAATSTSGDTPIVHDNTNPIIGRDESEDDDDDDGLIDTEPGLAIGDRKTLRERFSEYIGTIREFCDGLEYQLQFEDHRMLETVEREGVSFMRLAQNCLSRECRMNSSRGSSPTTWERETSRAMFYRTRPPRRDVES
jgi:hypothetical protein